jgi:hypothetical protein
MKSTFSNRFLLPVLFFFLPFCGFGFGVLTHEAIVDALWDKSIMPLLKSKYPSSTAEEQKVAHAYAYGGAICPDMGYYPFGSPLFTNLVHYVRSGDMVNALLRNANNLNEYAFALGFLSHYNADNYGHPLATNKSVPLVYPSLRKKYGDIITYADNKISHMRMEFGFDVLQISKGNYASQAYHDFIGFKVDTSVLSRAFLETYGLNINEVFKHRFPLAVEAFRWIVANIFPVITKAAWAQKRSDIQTQDHTATSKTFRFKMHKREFNKEYGTGYKQPGFFPTLTSLFIRILPKVGPTRSLKFKTPTALSEKYFDQSFDTILQHYSSNLKQLKQPGIDLRDLDFDTGKPTAMCEYSLADDTYREWLLKLKNDEFKNISPSLKANIAGFYHQMGQQKNIKYLKTCNQLFKAYKDLEQTPANLH